MDTQSPGPLVPEPALPEVPPSQPRDEFMLSELPPEEENAKLPSELPESGKAGQSIDLKGILILLQTSRGEGIF